MRDRQVSWTTRATTTMQGCQPGAGRSSGRSGSATGGTWKTKRASHFAPIRPASMIFAISRVALFNTFKQAAVSKLERRADMYLSTLRLYIEAMDGTREM